jgi:pilus assembly protein CpaE
MESNNQDQSAVECIAFVSDNQTHGVVSNVLEEQFNDPVVRDGSTAQVIEYLSEASPPGILIVDLSDSASPLTAIMSLTAALTEETRIIGIGSVNDITLYREIVDAGATDYVVKPVTEKALTLALQRVNEPTAGVTAPQDQDRKQERIAVIGARGGVGVSTVATNIAWYFSQELNNKTVLVDLDLEFGTVALSLDLEPTRGLREALENPSRIDSLFISSATAKLTDNLSVMATEETLAEHRPQRRCHRHRRSPFGFFDPSKGLGGGIQDRRRHRGYALRPARLHPDPRQRRGRRATDPDLRRRQPRRQPGSGNADLRVPESHRP